MSLYWCQNFVSFHDSKFCKFIDLMATFSIDISTRPLSNVLLAVGFVISQRYYQLLFKEFSLNLAVFQLRRWRFIADAYFASQRRWVYYACVFSEIMRVVHSHTFEMNTKYIHIENFTERKYWTRNDWIEISANRQSNSHLPTISIYCYKQWSSAFDIFG